MLYANHKINTGFTAFNAIDILKSMIDISLTTMYYIYYHYLVKAIQSQKQLPKQDGDKKKSDEPQGNC